MVAFGGGHTRAVFDVGRRGEGDDCVIGGLVSGGDHPCHFVCGVKKCKTTRTQPSSVRNGQKPPSGEVEEGGSYPVVTISEGKTGLGA